MFRKLVLTSILGVALTGNAFAAKQTVQLTLDGYCNTFQINIQQGYRISGFRSGCDPTPIVLGGTVATVGGTTYDIVNDSPDNVSVFTWYFSAPVNGKGRYQTYLSDGKRQTAPLPEGTYTVIEDGAAAVAPAGAPDITAR